MKTNNTSAELLLITSLLAPFIYLALIWNQIPAEIPGHYSDGGVDRYDPKGELALVMGGMTLLLYVVFRFSQKYNPNNNLTTPLYQKIRWLIMLFWTAFLFFFWTISWQGVEPQTLNDSILVGIGLLMAGLGNLMNNIKPNFFVGFRTPWTLTNKENWRRTHHLAARTFVIGGLLMVALVWASPTAMKPSAIVWILILMASIPFGYSFMLFRRAKKNELAE